MDFRSECFLNSIYERTVSENEKNLRFWEEYLKSLQCLDFSLYSEKLTVPVLVPVGSRILFRGELKHTNEVTVALGADYFAKCSVKQAEILRQHRIKDAESKVDMFKKEKEYLQNQISFSKQNIYDTVGQEIVEVYNEEEDRIWRQKHKENMKKHKIESKDKNQVENTVADEELWSRLEELELQEELENELNNMSNPEIHKNNDIISEINMEDIKNENSSPIEKTEEKKYGVTIQSNENNSYHQETPISKLDLLQQVIERQNQLGEKLHQIKQRDKSRSVTEQDLISKLDEMEQLDELEDEMDRLDDIIQGEDVEYIEEDMEKPATPIIKRSVSFADEDDSETIEITFKHSEVLPSTEPYKPETGIQKPSDIYVAFHNQFSEETTSILKKKKYECDKVVKKSSTLDSMMKASTFKEKESDNMDKTIIVNDVTERKDRNYNMVEDTAARPTSLFKKKRLQNKNCS